jgi:hypothetical protein
VLGIKHVPFLCHVGLHVPGMNHLSQMIIALNSYRVFSIIIQGSGGNIFQIKASD